MLTRTELSRLERSLRGTKVLSVYLDGAAADPAERESWRRSLANAIDGWRSALRGAPHDEREAFARAVAWLDAQLDATPVDRRSPGWVTFVTADAVRHAESLPAAPPMLVAWQDGIRVAPYVAVLASHGAAIAVVDSRTARLYTYRDRLIVAHPGLHAQAHLGPVTHMGFAPRQGFHPGTQGETGTDEAERARRVGRARMLAELAGRLVELAGADGWILVGGIPEVARAAVACLPDEVRPRARVVDGLDVHATAVQIADRAAVEVAALRHAAESVAVADVLERHGAGGTACIGRNDAAAAVEERAVARLYVTERFLTDAPLVAEEVVRGALAQDGTVTCVDGPAAERLNAEAGGVAARLRFRLARERMPIADEPMGATA